MSCPQSVLGAHQPEANGRCRWCGARCEQPTPRPPVMPVSDLTEAYRYHFDPDFGVENDEVYGGGGSR